MLLSTESLSISRFPSRFSILRADDVATLESPTVAPDSPPRWPLGSLRGTIGPNTDHLSNRQVPNQEVVPKMESCKFYVSPMRPECGKDGVIVLDSVPSRSGGVIKLKKPITVCAQHKAYTDRAFAEMRKASK